MKKYKTGITFGAWDLLHPGHMIFLRACMDSCDKLFVGLQWNPKMERPEKNFPVQSLLERHIALDMFLRDEEVIIPYETEYDIITMMHCYDINVRFIGSDYEDKEFTAKGVLPVVYIPREHHFSSSELRARIAEAERDKDGD